jgi:hypothetical protein
MKDAAGYLLELINLSFFVVGLVIGDQAIRPFGCLRAAAGLES